jgi:hypothetical protein
MDELLSREQLQDAARCSTHRTCMGCLLDDITESVYDCRQMCAKTALHYMDKAEGQEEHLSKELDEIYKGIKEIGTGVDNGNDIIRRQAAEIEYCHEVNALLKADNEHQAAVLKQIEMIIREGK